MVSVALTHQRNFLEHIETTTEIHHNWSNADNSDCRVPSPNWSIYHVYFKIHTHHALCLVEIHWCFVQDLFYCILQGPSWFCLCSVIFSILFNMLSNFFGFFNLDRFFPNGYNCKRAPLKEDFQICSAKRDILKY